MSKSTEIFFKEIKNLNPLSKSEEHELLRAYKVDGSRTAYDKLLSANTKFVVKMAFHYNSISNYDIGDLIGVGNLGMAEAVETFDLDMDMRFTSWAVWKIRANMLTEMAEQCDIVKIHGKEADKKSKLLEATRKLTQKYEREPTPAELSEFTKINENHVIHMTQVLRSHASLDKPSPTGKEKLSDAIEGDVGVRETNELQMKVNAVLNKAGLTDIERDSIRMYWGIGYSEPCTLQEIADKYSRTREGIRIIKKRALVKLEHFNQMQKAVGKIHLDMEMIR